MSGGVGPTGCDISLPKEQELSFKEQEDQQQSSLKNLNKPTTPPQQHKVGTFLSFNQLNSLAVVIVLSASGLVSPEDFAFVFFSLIYLHFIAKVAFPSLHPSRDPQEVFNPQNKLLQLYTLIGATIGLFTPIAYIFEGVFEGDKEGIRQQHRMFFAWPAKFSWKEWHHHHHKGSQLQFELLFQHSTMQEGFSPLWIGLGVRSIR